jgi:pyruvate-formate lyase-activating enzyme
LKVASVADGRSERETARSGFLPHRIVHLHATRLCNLACRHCYSESDPGRRPALAPDAILPALEVLRAEGYTALSLSGGEPLVYGEVAAVVAGAKGLGYRVTMVTNGLLVSPRTAPLLARLDGLAISFDGLAATHDEIRGRDGAFERACAAVGYAASTGRPVGGAISLARDAIPELSDLADRLIDLGARTLQIRPVARAGRARSLPQGTFYSAADEARLYLAVAALQEAYPGIRIHGDLAPAHGFWEDRDAYRGLLGTCDALPFAARPLADLVNPLVVTDTGALKPIAYDFDPRFDVAPVEGLSVNAIAEYKRQRLPRLQLLVARALAGLRGRHGLVDWFDYVTRASETFTGTLARGA